MSLRRYRPVCRFDAHTRLAAVQIYLNSDRRSSITTLCLSLQQSLCDESYHQLRNNLSSKDLQSVYMFSLYRSAASGQSATQLSGVKELVSPARLQ